MAAPTMPCKPDLVDSLTFPTFAAELFSSEL